MRSAYNLGRIFGVRIRLHYTWSVAFALIIAAVVTQFPEAYPLWQRMILGIVAGLLFLTAISMHELILSFVAISRGIPVKSVTLFVFGGVSQDKEATLPILELLMAAAGLLSNLVIAGVFYGVYLILVNAGNVMIAGITQWLAFLYFMLALFHCMPGFPLYGGRALLALLWKMTGSYNRAIRIASWIGWVIGWLFAIGGILLLVASQQWFVGLMLAFVGWVLQSAATQSRRPAELSEALQGFTARDVMTRECPLMAQDVTIIQLVRDCILVTGQRYFAVAEGGKLQGVVTTRHIKRIPKRRWNSTRIGAIMTPASKLKMARAEQSAVSLLEQMDESGVNEMPLVGKDDVIGIAGRDSIVRLAKTRAEFRV